MGVNFSLSIPPVINRELRDDSQFQFGRGRASIVNSKTAEFMVAGSNYRSTVLRNETLLNSTEKLLWILDKT